MRCSQFLASLSFALLLLSHISHGQEVVWQPGWSLLGECHGFKFEYRVSKEPANEVLAFRATNNTGDDAAGTATFQVRLDDGSFSGKIHLVAGTTPSRGYTGWWANGKTMELKQVNVAAANPHPVTGVRAAGEAIELENMQTMTAAQFAVIEKTFPEGSYYSMKDGKVCNDKTVSKFGWRIVKAKQVSGGQTFTLGQSVLPDADGSSITVDLQVQGQDALVQGVKAKIPFSAIGNVELVPGMQNLAIGKYACVSITCAEVLFKLFSSDGQAGEDSAGLLYFPTIEGAKAAVESLLKLAAMGKARG